MMAQDWKLIRFLRRTKNSHAIKYVKLSSSTMLETLGKLPGAQSLCYCENMNEICQLLGLPMSIEKVTMSDLVTLRDSIKRDIRIYCSDEGQQRELFALKAKYPKVSFNSYSPLRGDMQLGQLRFPNFL